MAVDPVKAEKELNAYIAKRQAEDKHRQIAAQAAALKAEGLARWQAQCTVPSQQAAFLEHFTAIERALGEPVRG